MLNLNNGSSFLAAEGMPVTLPGQKQSYEKEKIKCRRNRNEK